MLRSTVAQRGASGGSQGGEQASAIVHRPFLDAVLDAQLTSARTLREAEMDVLLRAIAGAITGIPALVLAVMALKPTRAVRANPGARLVCLGGSVGAGALMLEAIFPY